MFAGVGAASEAGALVWGLELAPIRVNAIAPGAFPSNMLGSAVGHDYSYIEKTLSNPNNYFTKLNGNTLWHLGLLERWFQLNVDS